MVYNKRRNMSLFDIFKDTTDYILDTVEQIPYTVIDTIEKFHIALTML